MRKVLAVGSIGVVVLLFLAVFPSIVSAQTIRTAIDEKYKLIQNIINKKDNKASSGIIQSIFDLFWYWWTHSTILNTFRYFFVLIILLWDMSNYLLHAGPFS